MSIEAAKCFGSTGAVCGACQGSLGTITEFLASLKSDCINKIMEI